MTTLNVAALGVAVEVHGLEQSAAEQLGRLWADCPAGGAGESVAVARTEEGWQATTRGRSWEVAGADGAVSATCAAINHLVTSRTPLLAFHAAVVTRAGVTAAIPGQSGAGKTTLAVALLHRGWRYVTDEALALEWDTGRLVSYPRPLAVSEWSRRTLGLDATAPGVVRSGSETWFPAAAVGAVSEQAPPAPTLIVLPTRGDDGLRLDRPHRAEALAALVQRGFTLHRDPARGLEVLGALCRASAVVRLTYADPRRAADALHELEL